MNPQKIKFDYNNPYVQKILPDFLENTRIKVKNILHQLLQLKDQPRNLELIQEIFRTVHSVKGAAGFIKFQIFSDVAHRLEDLLVRLKSQELQAIPPVVDLLLDAAAVLERYILQLERHEEIQNENSVLLEKMSEEKLLQFKQLKIGESIHSGISVLQVSGSLRQSNSEELIGRVRHLIEAGKLNVLLDFQSIDSISSYGIRTLLNILKELKKHQGDLGLLNVRPQIFNIIKITRLENTLLVFERVEDFLQHLAKTKN